MIEGLVLDTDIASDLFERRPRAADYSKLIEGKRLALSFATVAELYKWAIKRQLNQANIERLESSLKHYVIVRYDSELAWTWARVVSACEQSPARPIAPTDAWIPATAIRHDVTLFTGNIRHFETVSKRCGLRLARV